MYEAWLVNVQSVQSVLAGPKVACRISSRWQRPYTLRGNRVTRSAQNKINITEIILPQHAYQNYISCICFFFSLDGWFVSCSILRTDLTLWYWPIFALPVW